MRILVVTLVAGLLPVLDAPAAGFGAARIPAAAAQPARGAIVGRVDIQRPGPRIERRPDVAGLGAAAAPAMPDVPHAVVYLETAPSGAFEDRPAGRARMDQRNEMFLPRVVAVTVGAQVDFPNSDTTYHNVFSLSRPKRFDLGRYPQGRSRSVVFDRPGIVRVFCDIHSHMSAFVLVFSHPYYASTDADGRYRIDNVPPGTYTVVAWHEGADRDTRSVTVPPRGGEVELDFVVR
jgi:plastocyanin